MLSRARSSVVSVASMAEPFVAHRSPGQGLLLGTRLPVTFHMIPERSGLWKFGAHGRGGRSPPSLHSWFVPRGSNLIFAHAIAKLRLNSKVATHPASVADGAASTMKLAVLCPRRENSSQCDAVVHVGVGFLSFEIGERKCGGSISTVHRAKKRE
jgi:hypothetical protein